MAQAKRAAEVGLGAAREIAFTPRRRSPSPTVPQAESERFRRVHVPQRLPINYSLLARGRRRMARHDPVSVDPATREVSRFAVECLRQDGRRCVFQWCSGKQKAEGVAERLRAVGYAAEVVDAQAIAR